MTEQMMDILARARQGQIAMTDKGGLNGENWQVAGVPLGDGKFRLYQDQNCKLKFGENSIEIDIPQFSTSHNQVQIFDNPKQLFLTRGTHRPGSAGIVAFGCRLQGEIIKGDPNDYRDGFCAFNVLDFGTGMVFDMVTNGHNIWVIYERLLIPGLTGEKEAFTQVIPIDRRTNPHDFLNCVIAYNRANDEAYYYVDGQSVFTAQNIPVKIDSLVTGFGIITLHPIQNGTSTSCKGQGGKGTWSDFRVFQV